MDQIITLQIQPYLPFGKQLVVNLDEQRRQTQIQLVHKLMLVDASLVSPPERTAIETSGSEPASTHSPTLCAANSQLGAVSDQHSGHEGKLVELHVFRPAVA